MLLNTGIHRDALIWHTPPWGRFHLLSANTFSSKKNCFGLQDKVSPFKLKCSVMLTRFLVPEAFVNLKLSFFIWKLATRSADRNAKRLVKVVENLTFMLAQHLTAVKDVIFFWPIKFLKIFNPSNHMTGRAIKYILQSETRVKSWWHESKDPNGLDQRLSFLGSQHFVPKKRKRSGSRRKIKRKPLVGPG